jgi:hypothetical protein
MKVSGLGSSGVSAVSCSLYYTMAVTNDGQVMGWGHMHYSADSGRMPDSPVPVPSYGVTMSSIRLSFSNPVASSLSSLSLMFDVGFTGARSAMRSVVASGLANLIPSINSTAQCLNFAAHPVSVSFELSTSAMDKSLKFTLPFAMQVVNASNPVQCTVSMLAMPAFSVASLPTVNVTTFDANNNVVEAVRVIAHPAVFMKRSTAAVTVTLSSYVALASSVTAAVSFPAEVARMPIRSISIQGMLFAPLQSGAFVVDQQTAISSLCQSFGQSLGLATASWTFLDDRGTLSIKFLSDVIASGGDEIVCTLTGFTNRIATPAVVSAVAVATYFANGTGNVISSGGTFPAIFYAAANTKIAVSNNACRREFVFTVSIEPVTTAAAVKVISVSGLPAFSILSASIDISCTLQQKDVSAQGILGSSSLSITLSTSTHVVGGPLICGVMLLGPAHGTTSSSSVSVATYAANGTPLEIKTGLSLPAFLPIVVSGVGPHSAPQTGHTAVTAFGNVFGDNTSHKARLGGTAVCWTRWISDTSVALKVSGLSSAAIDFPVQTSVQNVEGSITHAFTYSAPAMVNASRAIHLPTTGGNILNVVGRGFGFSSTSSVARTHAGSTGFISVPQSSMEATFWSSSSSIDLKMPRSKVRSLSIVTSVHKLSDALFVKSASLLVLSNSTNIPNSGSHWLLLMGVGFGGQLNTAASRFGFTAAESTSWKSDSGILSRTNLGIFSPDMALFSSLSQVSQSLSSAASFDLPHISQVTSEVLSDISISGSNFGPYFAVVSHYANCSFEGIVNPNSDLAICSHTQLSQLRTSGVSILEMGVSVSFDSVIRLDDVVLVLVSPFDRNFTLMKNKCFGCTSQNSTKPSGVSFSFRVPAPSNHPAIPDVACPTSGSYTFPYGADVSKAFSTPAVLGPWFVRVFSGTVPIRVSRASFYFKTSSLQVFIGVSTVSSITWNSDSSASVGAPGLQTQNNMNSARGWGRSRRVRGQVIQAVSLDYCNYAYPTPMITDVARSSVLFGSSLSISGRYFSNSDPTLFVRVVVSSCAASRWVSDTCVLCVVPRATGRVISISASVEFSVIAKLENLTLSSAPADVFVGNKCFPTSGGVLVSIVGKVFGIYDSSVALRASSKFSSAVATFWRHDTSVVTKVSILIPAVGIALTVSRLVNESVSQTSIDGARSVSIVSRTGLSYIASTGSHMRVISNGFGNFGSLSHQLQFGNSVAELSSWISDSSTRCKSSRGYKPVFEVLLASLQLSVWSSSYSPAAFQSPTASFLNVTLAENFTHMNGSGFGVFDSVQLNFNALPAIVDWTSDSSISCRVPISRDVFDIQLDFFGVSSRSNGSVSAVARNVVPNPVFVASSKPIVQSLNSLVYIPAPADFHNHVNMYIQRGSLSGWTFPVQDFLSASFLYSEVISIDIAIFNNHTQVYLKDYLPYTLPVFGNISIVDSDENTLDALVCFGNLMVASSVPSKGFAAWLQISIAICSEVTIPSTSIIFRFSVLDEMGKMISFTSRSAAFSVQSRPPAILQNTITRASISAGSKNPHVLNVSLSNVGNCSRLVFEYSANISCVSGLIPVARAFCPHGF